MSPSTDAGTWPCTRTPPSSTTIERSSPSRSTIDAIAPGRRAARAKGRIDQRVRLDHRRRQIGAIDPQEQARVVAVGADLRAGVGDVADHARGAGLEPERAQVVGL